MINPISRTNRPSLEDFKQASKRINMVAIRTPLVPLRWYRENLAILLKPEVLQPIGSYKIRGVYNWVSNLPSDKRARGITTISSGNMAQALAYVANLFNIPAKAVVWNDAPKTKIEAIRKYGAEVLSIKREDAFDYVESLPEDHCFLHGLMEYRLVEGHGTIGLEIMEDAPETETIFVPVGAGLLGAGVSLAAKALKPSVRIIGVNSMSVPHYYESLKQGRPVMVERNPTLADGISGGFVTEDSLQLVRDTIDDVVLVSEDQMKKAIRYLALENKLVVEGAGAASLAAALQTPKEVRGKTVCVISGGSIDSDKLSEIIGNCER